MCEWCTSSCSPQRVYVWSHIVQRCQPYGRYVFLLNFVSESIFWLSLIQVSTGNKWTSVDIRVHGLSLPGLTKVLSDRKTTFNKLSSHPLRPTLVIWKATIFSFAEGALMNYDRVMWRCGDCMYVCVLQRSYLRFTELVFSGSMKCRFESRVRVSGSFLLI